VRVKFKDKAFVMAVLGAIVLLVQNIALLFGVELQPDVMLGVVNATVGVLVIFGIIPKKENSEVLCESGYNANIKE